MDVPPPLCLTDVGCDSYTIKSDAVKILAAILHAIGRGALAGLDAICYADQWRAMLTTFTDGLPSRHGAWLLMATMPSLHWPLCAACLGRPLLSTMAI